MKKIIVASLLWLCTGCEPTTSVIVGKLVAIQVNPSNFCDRLVIATIQTRPSGVINVRLFGPYAETLNKHVGRHIRLVVTQDRGICPETAMALEEVEE